MRSMEIRTHIEDMERHIGRAWKTMALRGLLGIAFGLILLAWPGIGLTTLIALFGATFLLIGLVTIGAAVDLPASRRSRGWLVVEGMLAIGISVAVFIWPDLTARGLLFMIAAAAVAAGLLQVGMGAFALPVTGTRALIAMVLGAVSVAFGVVMFAHPGAGALALLSLIAAFAIVTGAIQVSWALELRRVAAKPNHHEQSRRRPKPALHG